MTTTQRHSDGTPATELEDCPSKVEHDMDPDGLLNRIQTLQALGARICAEVPQAHAELGRLFSQELEGLRSLTDQAFDCLQGVISTIREQRSQWEIRTEGLIARMEKQLSQVTAITETATHQILDAVEKLISMQTNTSRQMTEILSLVEQGTEPVSSPRLLDSLRGLVAELETAQSNALQIMDYLQFQDIAAQQIEQAYGLLGETEENLVSIALTFRPTFQLRVEMARRQKSGYDVNAEYAPAEEKQKQIDAMFQK
ncbi:MAG: protein phosphatase CheZ [bacterium]